MRFARIEATPQKTRIMIQVISLFFDKHVCSDYAKASKSQRAALAITGELLVDVL